ncbi:MAG: PadR family transcriptional regulator, partial [Acidobacteria bacterium]|nr:PadR family transcriptional regulator [Acidobacteriota bacterium]
MTDIVVLATLLSGPKHGYQLKHQAGLILGQANLHNNLVYPLLRRFAEQGWVTRKTVAGRRGQTRLQYAITASGRKALISKLTEFSGANARSLDAFLARVGLFQVLDPRAREGVLEARSAHLRARNEHLSGIAERFSLDLYARATIEFLRSQVEAELAWIGH